MNKLMWMSKPEQLHKQRWYILTMNDLFITLYVSIATLYFVINTVVTYVGLYHRCVDTINIGGAEYEGGNICVEKPFA